MGQYQCINCGTAFRVSPSRDTRPNKYCSQKCYRDHLGSAWVTQTCEKCGEEFQAKRYYVKRGQYRFCSVGCRRASDRKGLGIEQLDRQCEHCATWFRLKPVEVLRGKNRRFCSRTCRVHARGLPTAVPCKTCGQPFKPSKPSVMYCSMACYRRSRTESLPEFSVKYALTLLRVPFREEVPIGRYSVDFVIDEKIALEIDGDYWHKRPENPKRARLIKQSGYHLIRVDSKDVMGDQALVMIARLLLEVLADVPTFYTRRIRNVVS